MPVHQTPSGWQWGEHGHVYGNRADAERQARAARANGYTGDSITAGAGVALTLPDGRMLFLRRGDEGDHPGEWCFPGGGLELGETAEDAVRRECGEEIGGFALGPLRVLARHVSADGVDYTTFRGTQPAEFEPRLNGEHSDYAWAHPGDVAPLHPGVQAILRRMGAARLGADRKMAMDRKPDRLAFDRGTVRTKNEDGRLIIEITHISKATVNEYAGAEIPDAEALGLSPMTMYRLLRDPEELEKSADTFNNLPVLSRHVPFTADKPPKELVIGTTGTDAVFSAPYLDNSMSIWDAVAIEGIETRKQQEISAAYRYKADMTPGTFEGMPYDGVMRSIRGNHVAIVREGRAGPDVVVGDSKPRKGKIIMSKKSLSMKAALVQGAILGFLPTRLAADAKFDLPAFMKANPITAKTWAAVKPKLIAAIKPVLAQDADVAEMSDLMNEMDGQGNEDVGTDAEGDTVDQFLDGLQALVSKFMQSRGAAPVSGDDPPPFQGKPKTGGKGEGEGGTDPMDKKDMVSKPAMDAAITAAVIKAKDEAKLAVDEAVKKAREDMRAVEVARETVRPWVGKIAMACDSADDVFKEALGILKVPTEGMHPSAYKHVLQAQPQPGKVQTTGTRSIFAQDAKDADTERKELEALAPDAFRLEGAGA